jgi:hypothetical protein
MSVYAANTIEHDVESSSDGAGRLAAEDDEIMPFVDLSSENTEIEKPGHLAAAQSVSSFEGIEGLWVGSRIDTWKGICQRIAEREYNAV